MGAIEPINKFTQTQSKLQKLQTFLYTKKCRGSWKKKVFFFFFWVELWVSTPCVMVVLVI